MNNTIVVLALVLLVLMVIIGGRNGLQAFASLIVNFALLFLTVVLIAWGFPPLPVTMINSVIILAVTIFFGEENDVAAQPAFIAGLLVTIVLVLLIIPVEHWTMAQGFSLEDSEDLEGMSLPIGVSFLQITITTAILSTLGAIAEAAIAIAAGLSEILSQHSSITGAALFKDGIAIGKQIIGTTFNTLFFGFFGGFLALFIWFLGLHYSFGQIINNKIFASEMLMILFSIMGVILTVPITTLVMSIEHHHQMSNSRHND